MERSTVRGVDDDVCSRRRPHFIQDMHVYDRHEEQANELLCRSLFGPVPQVTISSRMEGKGFYDFVADDFEVWNYEPKEQIKFEVAK